MRVFLKAPLPFNRTGYDREVLQLPAGEQDGFPELVAWLARNPGVGEVLPNDDYSPGHNAAPGARDEPNGDSAEATALDALLEGLPKLAVAKAREALLGAELDSPMALEGATDEQLLALAGVGPKTVAHLRDAIERLKAGDGTTSGDDA